MFYAAVIDGHFVSLKKKIVETAEKLKHLARKTDEDQTLDQKLRAVNVKMMQKFQNIIDRYNT